MTNPGAGNFDPLSLLRRGVELQRKGRFDEAEQAYRRVLAHSPDQADTLGLLGILIHQKGDSHKALPLLRRAVERDPANIDVQCNLGIVLAAVDRLEDAIPCYRRALALDAGNVAALVNLATALRMQGELDSAVADYRRALARDPRNAPALSGLGIAYRQMGELDAAIVCCRRAIALAPRSAAVHNNLGNSLRDMGRFAEAIASYRQALAIDPRYAKACDNLGVALRLDGQLVDALACHRQALEIEPELVAAHANLGQTLLSMGRFEEARAALRRTLEIDPTCAVAFMSLASITKLEPAAPLLVQAQGLSKDNDLATDDRAILHFGLGKAFNDLGDYDRAFEHFATGNALRRALYSFDIGTAAEQADRIRATFSRRFFDERADLGNRSDRPVFIVGMPRSGTSLVEQILSSHPDTAGAGELTNFTIMTQDLPALLGIDAHFPECAPMIDAALAERLAAGYLARLDRVSPDTSRVTDKLPGNYLNLGLIALLFPSARVVWCRRDPLDVCLSCFATDFGHRLRFTNDLGDLGAFYRQYEGLMAHWRAVQPVPLHEVRYERLIADPEPHARDMVAFCGLDWDDACLAHHKSDRPILTASSWQARQPIYRSSAKRWKRYEKHLTPLLEALGDLVPVEQADPQEA